MVLEPNRPVFAVQTRTAGGLPGPVANTWYRLHVILDLDSINQSSQQVRHNNTYPWECSAVGEREQGKENDLQENDYCINASSDWKNRIDCIPSIHTYSNDYLSVEYLTLWWISGMLEYGAIFPADIGATDRDHWGWMIKIKGAREIQEQVEDGEEVLNPETSRSVFKTVHHTFNNKFEHKWLHEGVTLLNAGPILQWTSVQVPGNIHSNWSLLLQQFVAYQVWATWYIVGWWVWDWDMTGVLVADEKGLGTTFTSVAVAMICKLRTENVVMGLLLSMLWGNTLEERVNMVENDNPGIIGENQEWYTLHRMNAVPCCHVEIQITPPQGHRMLTSALEQILMVTMPEVAETFKSGRDIQECHWQHDICARIQTCELVARG